MQLSEEQCQHFRREHYLVVRDVLPAGAIEAMWRELDEAVEYVVTFEHLPNRFHQ